MDSYLTEYNYLKAFKANTGVKQDLNLSGQILASLARVLHEYTSFKIQHIITYMKMNNITERKK